MLLHSQWCMKSTESQSTATNSLPVCVALCDDNKDNFLQDNGAKAYSGPLCALSPRMALSAVNILHLNGPLEAKQTQTGFHTNDQRGPGVRQGTRHVSVCLCAWMCKRVIDSVCLGGDVVYWRQLK